VWKWIIVLVLMLGAAGGGVVFVATSGAGSGGDGGGISFDFGFKKKQGIATPVRVEPAGRGDLVRTVSAPGSIEPRTLVKISSQVSAKVLAVTFREGDRVKADDVLLRLDPQNLVAQLESAKAGLRSEEARLDGARADLINARLDYERAQHLVETGDAPRAELDAAEARYLGARSMLRVIEASIEIARANITRVETDLENTVISTPIDGTVIALNTEVGETVIVGTTNTPGSVVMEIADLSSMLVKAQVDETNIAPVSVGQPATVYINAYDEETFRGKVEKIGRKRNISASGTGYFIVEIALELAEGRTLLSGLTASVDIEVEPFFDVVRVPSQAVLDRRVEELPEAVRDSPHIDRQKTFATVVYRMIDGKAVTTPVKVGPSDLTHTVILEGLDADELVVVGPYRELDQLKHDKPIRDESKPEQPETPAGGAGEADGAGEAPPGEETEETPADGGDAGDTGGAGTSVQQAEQGG
jgi:HlyD family secretion protein